MNTVRRVALIFGVAFLVIGVAGFFVTGLGMTADVDRAPRLFDLFPMNALQNVVHLLFGVWGLAAARSVRGAVVYARVGGLAYLGLAALGFVAPDLFGLMPIGSDNIWLHALLGAVLAGVGFSTSPRGHTVTHPATHS